jgi:hypothetical protein
MVEDGYAEPLHVEAKSFALGTRCHEIAHAGYSVGKAKGGRRSGLDVSKKSPQSLFYLPSQAKARLTAFSTITMTTTAKSSIQ